MKRLVVWLAKPLGWTMIGLGFFLMLGVIFDIRRNGISGAELVVALRYSIETASIVLMPISVGVGLLMIAAIQDRVLGDTHGTR